MRLPSLRICSFIALLPLTALLTGCGDELNCSADETRQLVNQIAHDEFVKSAGPNINQSVAKFSIDDIISTEKGKTKTACKAKLHMTVSAPDSTKQSQTDLNITYNVEKTDDGRLYVTVFGL